MIYGNDDNNNTGDLRRSYTTSIQLNKHLCAGAGSPGGGHLDHLLEGGGGGRFSTAAIIDTRSSAEKSEQRELDRIKMALLQP